ncbi:MAG TPA: STAS domain-containing protein [Pyrinomonadaceae bacterium]|nr:STAS domain-containing protein [Pyrinomonadaceae bacterium]
MDDLLNRAPCGFLMFTDDGRIKAVNETLLRLLGHDAEALTGQHLETILPVASRIFYQTHLFPLLKMHGRAEEVYFSLRTKQGEDVPVLVNAQRRERDGAAVYDCVIIPMRQRLRYEDEILEAKREAEEANRIKDELITELSTPVITVWEGILLAPIIGSLTRERAEQMTDALLHATVERRARVVILDITGVRTIDTAVVQRLVQSVAAIVLLGAECILTGVSGAVAQTLVHLGLDLSGIRTRRRLAEGLQYALEIAGSGHKQ